MYAISRVYREPDVVPTSFSQRRVPLSPSSHVQLRPVPPTPRRAPQPLSQGKHHPMCACDACQPTFPMLRSGQVAQGSYSPTRTQRGGFVYESVQVTFPEAEQDLRSLLVPTIFQRLRASIEAHPLIWLGVSYVLKFF
jgi:hypothetical protein